MSHFNTLQVKNRKIGLSKEQEANVGWTCLHVFNYNIDFVYLFSEGKFGECCFIAMN